ncbi:MAG TPA: HisA/HisF-related TIM barrel protein [Gemmatimonadales bacterium]|nr:HisA/HisF-related TIM barrel protein [Gemmatimonadales bacterium]
MRVIPVLDLKGGQAVLARGGRRDEYRPVRSVLAPTPGDARALAQAYRRTLGCEEAYVADLDAIAGGTPQRELLTTLAASGLRLLVDAGVATPAAALDLRAAGADRVVVGLETLPSFDALAAIVRACGRDRVVFSLDLMDGHPLTRAGATHDGEPLAVAAAALRAGAGAVLVLDLARIGSARGPDLELVEALSRLGAEEVELLAGGGIRSVHDLRLLAAAGCRGALVGSALHEGGIDAAGVADQDRASR